MLFKRLLWVHHSVLFRVHIFFHMRTSAVLPVFTAGAAPQPHLTIKSHSEVGAEQPAAGLDHLHDFVVGSVQSVVESAEFLQKINKKQKHHQSMSATGFTGVCAGVA